MVFIVTLIILLVVGLAIIGFLIYQSFVLCKEIKFGKADSELIYEDYLEKNKVNKNKQIWKKVLNIFVDLIIVILAIFLLLGISDRFITSDLLPIKGVVVLTGSMSYKNSDNEYLFENNLDNQIGINDLIFVEKIEDINEINLYDVICYKTSNNIQVVHRCVIKTENYLIAKGDANEALDDIYITNDNLVGRYTGYKIPYAGYITNFVSSEYGISVISILFLIGLSYSFCKYYINKYSTYRKQYVIEKINDSKDYVIVSSCGELYVKENEYKFIEYQDEKEVDSILKISDKEIALEPLTQLDKKNNKKGENKNEKEINR